MSKSVVTKTSPPLIRTKEERLRCVICTYLRNGPLQFPCGYRTCTSCARKLKQDNVTTFICKICKETTNLTDSFHDKAIAKEINNTVVTCPQCSWTGEYCHLQQRVLEPDTIPTVTPVQDTSSHTTSDHSFQESLENNSSGEMLQPILLGQLKIKTKESNANFSTELFSNSYQQWSNPPDGPPSTPISPSLPSVPIINPIQESHDQSDTMKSSRTHQAAMVCTEEQLVFH